MRLSAPSALAGPLLALGALGACTSTSAGSDAGTDGGACATLFGRPNDMTGLTSDQCRPACACTGFVWAPPDYGPAFIDSLVSGWALEPPNPPITTDPYASPAPPPDPAEMVCGVLPAGPASSQPRLYRLFTYDTEAAARDAGASPTHFGHCGACSPLVDLAVYMRENDLTAPVRDCGLNSTTQDEDVDCLQGLGFDLPCAQIYACNTAHTRSVCLAPCAVSLNEPYQLPDGGLNECLACDEAMSGPVFQAVAGRTRRNSGLANALCRPCSQVQPLVHDY